MNHKIWMAIRQGAEMRHKVTVGYISLKYIVLGWAAFRKKRMIRKTSQ